MSTSKNSQIAIYYRFNNIIKESGTSFESPALCQEHVKNFILVVLRN